MSMLYTGNDHIAISPNNDGKYGDKHSSSPKVI